MIAFVVFKVYYVFKCCLKSFYVFLRQKRRLWFMDEIVKKMELVECVLSTFDGMDEIDKRALAGVVIGYAIRAEKEKNKVA